MNYLEKSINNQTHEKGFLWAKNYSKYSEVTNVGSLFPCDVLLFLCHLLPLINQLTEQDLTLASNYFMLFLR